VKQNIPSSQSIKLNITGRVVSVFNQLSTALRGSMETELLVPPFLKNLMPETHEGWASCPGRFALVKPKFVPAR